MAEPPRVTQRGQIWPGTARLADLYRNYQTGKFVQKCQTGRFGQELPDLTDLDRSARLADLTEVPDWQICSGIISLADLDRNHQNGRGSPLISQLIELILGVRLGDGSSLLFKAAPLGSPSEDAHLSALSSEGAGTILLWRDICFQYWRRWIPFWWTDIIVIQMVLVWNDSEWSASTFI